MSQWMFELTPLTPLHIGTGETLEPYEYVILDSKLYQFSPEQLLMKLSQKEQDVFVNLIGSNPVELQHFLQQRRELVKPHAPYPIPVAPAAHQVYNKQPNSSLYPFIKTSSKPFIPGSSLKGAIRTALLYDQAFLKAQRRPIREFDCRRLEQQAFSYTQVTDDPFKSFKVGDSETFAGATRLELVKVYTKAATGWRERNPMLREVTQSRLSSNFQQSFVHPVQLVQEFSRYDHKLMKIEMGEIITACRQFYTEHLTKEKEYFANFPQTSSWYHKLIEWERGLPANSFLVRFGWGSGFDAVTVNYARQEREEKRSRRLSENGLPLGWAQVKVEKC